VRTQGPWGHSGGLTAPKPRKDRRIMCECEEMQGPILEVVSQPDCGIDCTGMVHGEKNIIMLAALAMMAFFITLVLTVNNPRMGSG